MSFESRNKPSKKRGSKMFINGKPRVKLKIKEYDPHSPQIEPISPTHILAGSPNSKSNPALSTFSRSTESTFSNLGSSGAKSLNKRQSKLLQKKGEETNIEFPNFFHLENIEQDHNSEQFQQKSKLPPEKPIDFEKSGENEKNPNKKKKEPKDRNKKLIFLSKEVLKIIKHDKETTGTQIAAQIIKNYEKKHQNVEFKNIQRRVYDAVNVLSALEYITKSKTGGILRFRGFNKIHMLSKTKLEQDIQNKAKRINLKKGYLLSQIIQLISLKNLTFRNRIQEPSETSRTEKIHLPFTLLEIGKNSNAQILLDETNKKLLMGLDKNCKFLDENYVLHQLKFSETTFSELEQFFPKAMINVLQKNDFLSKQTHLITNDLNDSQLISSVRANYSQSQKIDFSNRFCSKFSENKNLSVEKMLQNEEEKRELFSSQSQPGIITKNDNEENPFNFSSILGLSGIDTHLHYFSNLKNLCTPEAMNTKGKDDKEFFNLDTEVNPEKINELHTSRGQAPNLDYGLNSPPPFETLARSISIFNSQERDPCIQDLNSSLGIKLDTGLKDLSQDFFGEINEQPTTPKFKNRRNSKRGKSKSKKKSSLNGSIEHVLFHFSKKKDFNSSPK